MHAAVNPESWATVEELVSLLTDLYGAGLARIIDLTLAGGGGQPLLTRLTSDDLVASLLVVHGLHPDSFTSRVERALQDVRPYLASHGGDVELVGVDEDLSAVQLRMLGSCHGCPSSSITLKLAVERAIEEAAPEVTRIDVEGDEEPEPVGTPIRLGPKPAPQFEVCPVPTPGDGDSQ